MPASDPLDELRARVRATQEAAERLAGEWRPPEDGWSAHERDDTVREIQALAGLVTALRDLVPPDLVDQLREIVRQLLLLVRAIIDWWVERIEAAPSRASRPPDVQDIPIA